MLIKYQDGVECTTVMDQYIMENGTTIVAMVMA